ncbi:MAG: spore germination protein [Clostridia bacterium]|nr:spore germination protein [Clostridia bacterium]
MHVEDIKQKLKQSFDNATDLVFKKVTTKSKQIVVLVWIENIVDQQLLAQNIIAPLQKLDSKDCDIKEVLQNEIISFGKVSTSNSLEEIESKLLEGFCIIFNENMEQFIVAECAKWIVRLPNEPPTSAVLEGPREGFVEDIISNTTLLRRRLKTKHLKIEDMTIGNETNSSVKLIYLNNVADPKLVQNVKEQLNNIVIDGVVDSHYLVEFLTNKQQQIFKQIGSTEKPDIATAKILEGRIAILCDGSPIALTVPYILLEDLQSSNDYYTTTTRATIMRYLRLFAGIIAILLPGLYIALLSYHLKTIPIKLLITITNSIQGIPLPPFLEVLFIIFLFEILYEASLRMPRYVGLALSVVGALILGDTAVKAGLVSPPAVLIVAITGVMSYTLPEQISQISFLRIVFTFLGGLLGLYGIIIGGIFLIGYLVSLDSFGVPYLAPFAPYISSDQKDGLTRSSLAKMKNRPSSIPNINKKRQ